MSATSVYVSGDTPSALPPIPGPGDTTTTVGTQPQEGGVLPETGYDLGVLAGIVILVGLVAFLLRLSGQSNR